MFSKTTNVSWKKSIAVFGEGRVLALFFLGFSAGLPLLLVFTTLSIWLRELGLSRTTIGFISWIAITYSIKVFWAPVVDCSSLFGLTLKFGRRRTWMLISMVGVAFGLIGMASVDPEDSTQLLIIFAFVTAFFSATQDISIDAFRIESAPAEIQGALAAAYQLGYRMALLVAGAGALYISDQVGWNVSYGIMAALMAVGITTVFFVPEPCPQYTAMKARSIRGWLRSSILKPFEDFFGRYGKYTFSIILFVAAYRISDISMGIMANPFYIDLGFTKSEIASVIKIFGFTMTIFGTFVGGLLVTRYGIMGPLLCGAILVAVTNLLFAVMALVGRDIHFLMAVVSADSVSGGLAGSAFIAYLSNLTRSPYTATQYALLSSLMTLPGKFIGGFSGIVVDGFGYMIFFAYVSALGLPAIFLCTYLANRAQLRSG